MLTSIRQCIAAVRRDGRLTTYKDRYRFASLASWFPLPLPRILTLFGSDKQRSGQHSYGSTYAVLFRPFRYKRIKLLEIGLLYGESLLAWRCFFPFGTTVGIDIEPKEHLAGNRTRTYVADQGSASDLAAVCQREGPFDIVIDDGSHLNHHQLFSFNQIFPSLKDGGLYIIEDVQTSFWPGGETNSDWDGRRITEPEFGQTCYGVFLELAKYLNHAEFITLRDTDPAMSELGKQIIRIAFEHNMIVIWKGRNDQLSNFDLWLKGIRH